MNDERSSALVPASARALSISSRLAERTLSQREERSSQVATLGRTLIVGAGGHATIGEAVAGAKDGDMILVRPGTYHETVTIEHEISLFGSGPRSEIVVWWDGLAHVISLRAPSRLSGLTVRQGGPDGPVGANGYDYYSSAVLVDHLGAKVSTIEDCDLSAVEWAGVLVTGGASVEVARCSIHDCRSAGVDLRIGASSKVTIVGNDLGRNGIGVWMVRGRPTPTIRNNFIHDHATGIGSNFEFGGDVENNRFERNRIDITKPHPSDR